MEQDSKTNIGAPYDSSEYIDLRSVIRTIWKRKWFFVKIWIVTFILACAYILPQPRLYSTYLTLAPELGEQSPGGGLAGIASSFGIDLGSIKTEDAFYPELYPDVMSTNEFLTDLLYTRVKTLEGDVDTTYLCFLTKYRKKNPVAYPFNWCKAQIASLFEKEKAPIDPNHRLNPRQLSSEEESIMDLMRQSISCDVDIKTNVITIGVTSQDPLICVTLADSACARLQDFITSYRTSKARIDMEYYQQLMDSAKMEFDRAVVAYSRYCDSHQNVILQSYVSERDELENIMQTKLTTYNAMQTQYQAAKARIQERTPAFTMLQKASIPTKPTAPKRMIFVAVWLFLSTIGTCIWIFRKSISNQFLGTEHNAQRENK